MTFITNWKSLIVKQLVFVVLLLPVVVSPAGGQVNLRYEQNETLSWEEAIGMYGWLDEQYKEARLVEAGMSDAGKPLHLFIISKDQLFSGTEARQCRSKKSGHKNRNQQPWRPRRSCKVCCHHWATLVSG